ncbi:hypothetical protein DSO57_1032581 [Entomophthora muscae]|uniref:Uncharacterized protein n=1 Tax=Entomophthora muscae TaxID=34485 RepID=A0ACC2TYW2_9FUNG|nr:hypothetical protein DSO57_1032581 [Entomophthora muscae]
MVGSLVVVLRLYVCMVLSGSLASVNCKEQMISTMLASSSKPPETERTVRNTFYAVK